MAFYLPNGSTVEVQSAIASAVSITALSNASEAVATATNTYSNGDIVVVTSGWNKLSGRVVRTKAVSGTSFTMEGIDTTDTVRYPALGGTGSSQKVTGWTQIPQIVNMQFTGGDQNFTEFQFLDEDYQRRLPTFKSAITLTFDVADDPTLPWYAIGSAANDDRVSRAFRINMPNGSKLLASGLVTMTSIPKLQINEVAAMQVTVSLTAQPTRYAS